MQHSFFNMEKLKDITILTSASGSPTMGKGGYRNLKERKVTVVGVDMTSDPSAKYLVDKFYKVPPVTADEYIDVILDICKRENVDIYFPNISIEVEKVCQRRKEFEKLGVILSISNMESIEIANNKLKTYQALEKAGIPVPRYYGVYNVKDFIEGCRYMGFPEKPVCLKIVDGSGSRGVRIIDSKKSRYDIFVNEKPNSFYTSYEDMLSILESAPKDAFHEMMLLEYLHGPEFTVDALAEKGKTLYIAGRENVVSLMSIAMESVVTKDEAAEKIAKDVIELLNMDGNVGFDFMRNEANEPVLTDINPRLTATVALFSKAGLPLQYLRIKQLLGEPLPNVTVALGTRVKRRYTCQIFTDANGNLIK